jgi:hypothetical protein
MAGTRECRRPDGSGRGTRRNRCPAGYFPAPAGYFLISPSTSLLQLRCARFAADTIAFSEAVTMLRSMPTPHSTWPAIAHST